MSKYIYGAMHKNLRRGDNEKFPNMMGWIDFQNGKASVAGWTQELDIENNRWSMKLTLQPWATKSRVYSHGQMSFNTVRKYSNSPQFLGNLEWGGTEYTIAAWLKKRDKNGNPYFRFTIKVVERETYDAEANEEGYHSWS